ncbi:protein FAM210A [Ctenodactylus gundi]
MQWNVPRATSQLARRVGLEPPKAALLGCWQNVQGPSLQHSAESRAVRVHSSPERWLHLAATQRLAEERPPRPRALCYGLCEKHPHVSSARGLSSSATAQGTPSEKKEEPDPLQDKSISLYQRFKKTFRQYGKVLIPVHLITSGVWFGTFYYASLKGVNVVPFLELIGLPDSVVNILKNSQSGNALTAYAMFKIATPARYTVTLGGTSFTVKYLRSRGYMSTPPPVKEYLQDRMEETKELITEKMEETKGRLTEKLQETKEKVSFKKKVE